VSRFVSDFELWVSDFDSLAMNLKFENKMVLVTASTAGIGFAIALELGVSRIRERRCKQIGKSTCQRRNYYG